MPELLQQGAVLMCVHGGPVLTTVCGPGRVRASGQPLLTGNDQFMVCGCVFQLPTAPVPTPHPCIEIQMQQATLASRIRISGAPAVLRSSMGLCKAVDQMVQGIALVVNTQVRVGGL